ncbi:MAG: aerotolerance regulator BatC, partial [Bacteroidales bacterium]|nr:aerotolerance regulator BatC [Bacteroidales bacterium]
QDQNQDQNQNNQDQNQGQAPQQISQDAAEAMLQAIDAKEKQTKDKVDEKKAAVLQGKQKLKNW